MMARSQDDWLTIASQKAMELADALHYAHEAQQVRDAKEADPIGELYAEAQALAEKLDKVPADDWHSG